MTTVPIKGVVSSDDDAEVYEFFGYSTVTPSAVKDALNTANGQNIVAEINSPGGDVFAGSEIYTTLKNYTGNVEVDIVGLAASAASVIAMAGDTIKISPTAQLMIHRASTVSQGNADDLSSDLQGLNSTDQSIANVYVQRTGLDPQTVMQMMAKETYINAKDAVEQGFADEMMFDDQPAKVTNMLSPVMLSNQAISKIKSLLTKVKEKPKETNSQTSDQLRSHKLAILFKKEGN